MGKFIGMLKLYRSNTKYNLFPMDNLLGRQLNYNVQTPVYEGPLDLLLNSSSMPNWMLRPSRWQW